MLPEKWFIVRNRDNYKVLNKWNNEKYPDKNDAHLQNEGYFFSDQAYMRSRSYTKDYTEISFEDFKKYVLNIPEASPNYEIF